MKVFGNKIQIIILFLLVFPLIKGQVSNYYMDLHNLKMTGNYLGCLKYIKENYPITKDHQNLVMYHSFVGDYKVGLEIYFEENTELSKHVLKDVNRLDSLNLDNYKEIAKDSIFKTFAQSDALLINEAHHKNNHRIFLRDNMQELYNMGYKYLFVEALMSKELFEGRKFPLSNSLIYSEPIFGEMIRNALDIGFQVLSYDYMADEVEYSWQNREDAMAKNILKKLDLLPRAKFIIYGGYSHPATNTRDRRLGFQIKEKYKTVSIDQTIFSEEASSYYETNFYIKNTIDLSTIRFIKNDLSISEFDFSLIHPRTKYIDNKPDWYIKDKKKGNLNLLSIDCSNKSELLVQVYKSEEYKQFEGKSLPIYQFVEQISIYTNEIEYYYRNKENELLVIRDDAGVILFQSNIIDLI